MTGFWDSELGDISGKPEDAYTRTFAIVPDGTMALAKIVKCEVINKNDFHYINIQWELAAGDFKGQHIFQRIKCFDNNPKVRHKALNMLKLIYTMFHVKPSHAGAPENKDLAVFAGKHAGLKIQEWSMPKQDGSMGHGNFVSEVWDSKDFVSVTGKHKDFAPIAPKHYGVKSALTRNSAVGMHELNDDIPF